VYETNIAKPLWEGRGLSLSGWGHYFPRRCEQQPPELLPTPTRIEQSVVGEVLGVHSRHVADEDETVTMMAAHAARQAITNAGCDPAEIDLLIVSSWTDRDAVPEHAPRVALEIGASNALAFNVGGACIGFVHGVHTAASMLVAQGLRRAVVVAADRFTRRLAGLGWGNRLAGDGAGAIVIEMDGSAPGGLRDSLMMSFGEHADVATVSARSGWARSLPSISEVAASTAQRVVDILLPRNGLKLSDVDWVVTHPGSQKVLDALRRRFDIDSDRVLTNFAHRGSTAAATVPTAVSEYLRSGTLRHGDLLLTPSMGAGWFAGALLFTV
jgi:3-oxoacyl-[acyl-carrier-protein] synthase-3